MPHPVIEVVLPCPRASVGDDSNPSALIIIRPKISSYVIIVLHAGNARFNIIYKEKSS